MRRRNLRAAGAVVAVVALAIIVAAAFGGTSKGAVKSTKAQAVNTGVKGKVSFDGIWTSSTGQKQFQGVIAGFHKLYPNVNVHYKPIGNNLPTVLATAVAGGHPPDMADIAQPGTIQQFVDQKKLKPITYAKSVMSQNFAPGWVTLGTFNEAGRDDKHLNQRVLVQVLLNVEFKFRWNRLKANQPPLRPVPDCCLSLPAGKPGAGSVLVGAGRAACVPEPEMTSV